MKNPRATTSAVVVIVILLFAGLFLPPSVWEAGINRPLAALCLVVFITILVKSVGGNRRR